MIEKIKQLEKISGILDPEPQQRKILIEKIIRYSENFIRNLPMEKTYYSPGMIDLHDFRDSLFEDKINIDEALNLFEKYIEKSGINSASGGHFGYIPGSTLYHSALADFLAAVTNKYAGVYFASPGAVKMENNLIRWMADIVGYPSSANGNLTSGGSIANLIAVVTARESFNLKAKDYSKTVVYLTAQTHHSVQKALHVAGLKECIKHFINMDENYKMDAASFNSAIESDKKAGLIPWLVVASAGTTDLGAVDPLKTISEIATQNKIWCHVDGAYGAFFILTEKGKTLLGGIENSDSVVMDPHKGLFIPFGSGTVIIKDGKKLYDAHAHQAGYMQDSFINSDESSPADLSPELSKHFRGLRLWLPLKLLGLTPFRAALEEKLLLTKYAYERLSEIPGILLGPEPELSIFTFRFVPPEGDTNKFNKNLLEEIHNDGRVFLSSTMLGGNYTLRMAVLSYRTHLKEIDLAIDIIREKINKLSVS